MQEAVKAERRVSALGHARRAATYFSTALYAIDHSKVDHEVAQIGTPILVTDPEGEQFWPGQSQQLFDRLNGDKELAHFKEADGAGRHCEPLAPAQRDARVFDWLDSYLS
jgi:hypothetical protein